MLCAVYKKHKEEQFEPLDDILRELHYIKDQVTYPIVINSHPGMESAFELFIQNVEKWDHVEMSMGEDFKMEWKDGGIEMVLESCALSLSFFDAKDFLSSYLHFINFSRVDLSDVGLPLSVKILF